MTKRVLLAAGALLFSVGCGSSDSVTGTGGDEGVREDAGGTGLKDAGAARDASTTGTSSDPVKAVDSGNVLVGTPDDRDGDGFTVADGDCDDAEPRVNPGAFDFTGDNIDDDCSGMAAVVGENCDTGLALDSTKPEDAARAIGLCKFADMNSKGWGVVSARFTDATGTGKLASATGVGILPGMGAAKPGEGSSLLALSSGVARGPDQSGFTSECDRLETCNLLCLGHTPPTGYPKESSTCHAEKNGLLSGVFGSDSVIFDQSALEVKIRVPNNVASFSFDSIFYTSEYPDFVCSQYNDFYVVFKDPKPKGVADGNIVFDSNGDPIGVNTGLLAVCDPSAQLPDSPKQFDCAQGTNLLKGTGFAPGESRCAKEGGAATGWLHTTAPVESGQIITLRFAVWDTNDEDLDSTVLIDKFQWSAAPGEVATEPVLVI
jgi:hypothetical protein